MKIIIVGGVAGGASAAARIRRLDEQAQIIMFEKGEHVSFSNCTLPYYLGGDIKNSSDLVMMTPEKFKKQHNIDARTNSEVISIDRENKCVVVKNLLTNQTYTEYYDKLILSPGASPIMPRSIEGIDRSNVFSVRNVTDIEKIKGYVSNDNIKNIAVIGGGFIGVEIAENLIKMGKKVSLVEGGPQILAPFDLDIVQLLHKELYDNGVKLHLSSTLKSIQEKSIVLKTKDETEVCIEIDAVIMAIGVAPETKLATESGLQIGETRAILVNNNYQTSDENIYAIGDAVEIFNSLTHSKSRLALAGPAQKQARIVANHIYSIPHNHKGYIGSSCIRVFEQNAACTGLNERTANQKGYICDSVLLFPTDKVKIMPNSNYIMFKLVFEVPTGKILGAQAIGKGAADKRIDVIATLISMNGTVQDAADLELCYSPVFSTAKDIVNLAGLVANNILEHRYKQVKVDEIRQIVENDGYIIDVREKAEYDVGHIKNAHNIPLTQLRDRLDEIPKDRPVYVHCRSGQRSYYAVSCLQNNGFKNVYNISGSFLGICLYEYFNDVTDNKEPIVTQYNFN